VPSVRTPAGYRGYTDADLERLQLVLTYRAAGLPLDQHALLTEQANRLQDTIKAAEAAEAQARVRADGTAMLDALPSPSARVSNRGWHSMCTTSSSLASTGDHRTASHR
jgi:DNA-binding transcriptional MerR regulator